MKVKYLFFFVILLCSCATVKSELETGSVPSEEVAIVIGRSVVFHNEHEVVSNESGILAPATMIHVRRFAGAESVVKDLYAAGQYAIRVTPLNGGYFAVSLPPGNYYISEFTYPNMVDGFVGMRSYMPIPNSVVAKPVMSSFQASAGKINYVGTIVHNVNDLPVLNEGTPDERKQWSWSYSILNEYAATELWLHNVHPQLSSFVIKESTIKTTPYP